MTIQFKKYVWKPEFKPKDSKTAFLTFSKYFPLKSIDTFLFFLSSRKLTAQNSCQLFKRQLIPPELFLFMSTTKFN